MCLPPFLPDEFTGLLVAENNLVASEITRKTGLLSSDGLANDRMPCYLNKNITFIPRTGMCPS